MDGTFVNDTVVNPIDDAIVDGTRERRRSWPWIALLLVLTAAVFARGLNGGFVYDDEISVLRNPSLSSFSDLAASTLQPHGEFRDVTGTAVAGYWRPLANVALAVGRLLGGGSAIGFHALSLLIHLLCTWVAFCFVRRITSSDAVAFFAALLFGLHPVHVESVAWISAIDEVLGALFALLALDAFCVWRERGSNGSPWLAGAWFLCALLTKEMALAVVPLAIAIDLHRYLLNQRVARASVVMLPNARRAYAPLAAALALWYVARTCVFHSLMAGFDRTTTEFGVSFARLVWLRFELVAKGLELCVWPADLRVFHPFVPRAQGPWLTLAVCAAWTLLVVAAWKKRMPRVLLAALIAVLAMTPTLVDVKVLSLFPLDERHLYVAALGVVMLFAIGAWRYLPRPLAVIVLSAGAIALGVRSSERIGVWHDQKTLFTAATAEAPRSPYVHRVLGGVLLEEYRVTRNLDKLRAAHAEFERALDLGLAAQNGDETIFAVSADFLQANVGLAWSLIYEAEVDSEHDFSTPVELLRRVVKRYPQSPEALTALGIAHYGRGDLDEAQQALEQAVAIDDGFVEAHSALAKVWMQRGDPAKARKEIESALSRSPDNVDHMRILAGAQDAMGDDAAAMQTVVRALSIMPENPGLHVMRGNLMAKHGNLDPALAEFDRVLLTHPTSSEAWLAKGKVLLLKHETSGALRAFEQAAEFDTTNFEAHYNAGSMLAADPQQGIPAALPYWVRAYEHRGVNPAGKMLRATLLKAPIASADTLVSLATSDADHHDSDGALEWIERALKIDAKNGQALFLKGGMLREKGDKEGALSAWKAACEALPDSPGAFGSTASLLIEMGNRGEARKYLERALAIVRKQAETDPKAKEILPALEQQLSEFDDKGK